MPKLNQGRTYPVFLCKFVETNECFCKGVQTFLKNRWNIACDNDKDVIQSVR